MTICARLMVLQDSIGKLPASAQKDFIIGQMEELIFYTEKHEEGDKAISDQFHIMCNDCQKYVLENKMLKLEIERMKDNG